MSVGSVIDTAIVGRRVCTECNTSVTWCNPSSSMKNKPTVHNLIERIGKSMGTKDLVFNFQIPKQLLQVRKKNWNNLFNKYSKEMSDDIELNVDTLEPEEEEEEEEDEEEEKEKESNIFGGEEYSLRQHIPMRKSTTLVQYWVNTGNPPYKVLLDENELSGTGSSLSEEEITSSLNSPILNVINEDDKQEHKSKSSCSSVDTAAYILSTANVTKKADTIAIIEGAKCININSSKNMYIKDVKAASSDKIDYIETSVRTDDKVCNNDSNNSNVNTEFPVPVKHMASTTCDKLTTSTVQPNICLQSSICEESDETDVLYTNQRNLDVQSIGDVASISRQFVRKSKQLIRNNKNSRVSNLCEISEEDTYHERQNSANIIAQGTIVEDTSTASFYRKKLYTDRNSPVDLTLAKRHSTSKLSMKNQNLHPALDADFMIKRKTFVVHNSESKYLSRSGKRDSYFKKARGKRKRKRSVILNKNITDISNINDTTKIHDSIINLSSKDLSDTYNNLDRQVDIPFQQSSDTNISIKRSGTCRQDLASVNLNPIITLERIVPPFKSFETKSVINNHIVQESNVLNNRHLNKFGKLYTCEIEDLEMIDSDESTILICQCKMNKSQHNSSSNDQSFNLRLSTEDNFSASNTSQEDNKGSSLKNTKLNKISQHKELHVLEEAISTNKNYTNIVESRALNKNDTIKQKKVSNKSKVHSFNFCGINKKDNIKLRDVKVVLERLPLLAKKDHTNTAMETQVLNKNDTICRKDMLSEARTSFPNSYRTNKADNVKLPEIKVVLERLPLGMCIKRNNNVTNANTSIDKRKILQSKSVNNNKIESHIANISKNFPEPKTSVKTVCNNYSTKMYAKSRKINDRINDTFIDAVADYGNQIIEKKHSVLTFISSDEDDLIQLIKRPKKRLRMSRNIKIDEINTEESLSDELRLSIANTDKYDHSENPNMVIYSSDKAVSKKIGSIKEKRGESGDKMKSCDNKTAIASSQICKNNRLLFLSSENDYDSAAENLDGQKEKIMFFKDNKNMNNSNKSNKAIKNNGLDYGLDKDDVCITFFQTKTFDSSDSEESNNDTLFSASNRQTLKSSPKRHKSRNSRGFFNDSVAKLYSTEEYSENSLNSSFEKHNVADRIHNIKTKLKSIGKKGKVSKHSVNEEFSENINLRINDEKKNMSFFPVSFINKTHSNTFKQENTFTSIKESNVSILSENKQNFNKSKNPVVIQQDNIKPAVRKLLTFQTKDYYDSDSNESL